MSPETEPLVEANIDRARLGENWRRAIAQLIEAHELRNDYTATRKAIHVLMGRYGAAYFPADSLEYADKRYVITLLAERYFFRVNKRLSSSFGRRIVESARGSGYQKTVQNDG